MNVRILTAAAVPMALIASVGAATAQANPVTPPAVHYAVKLVGNVVETTLDGGHFQVAPDDRTVAIKDTTGATVLTLPLSVRSGGLEYPLPHRLAADAHVLDLTAVKDAARMRPAAAEPVASMTEDQDALNAFATQFGIATAIGSFLGTTLGALVGLLGIIGGPTVIASVITGAAVGAIVGTIVVGGPALVVAGIDLINTLSQPPGTTKWAHPNS